MSSVSTFGAFTTARLGIYAAQKALEVTGNNITNINTKGYTRQRLDQVSLRTGGRDKYQSIYDVNVGNGVLCTGVSQMRDPYLDIRYRNEQSNVGALDAKLSGLEQLSNILDEVLTGTGNNGKFQAQISDLLAQLDSLNNTPNQEEFDTLVRTSAEALVRVINTAASDLENLAKDEAKKFKQDLDSVNGILKSLGEINDSIMKSEIHGDPALEMRDQRNLLLDDLSQYMKIDVTYEPENVGAGVVIQRMVVKLAGSGEGNPDTEKSTLVNGAYATQVKMLDTMPEVNPKYDPNYVVGTSDPAAEHKYIKSYNQDGTVNEYTDDPKEANKVKNTNYDLALDALKDAKNRILEKEPESTIGTITFRNYQQAIGALTDTTKYPSSATLANGDKVTYQYEVTGEYGNYHIVTTANAISGEVALGDNDLYGSIQAQREMLTEAGEFTSHTTVDLIDSRAAIKRGIPYYQHALDVFASKFAEVLNEANTFNRTDKDGYLRDADGKFLALVPDLIADPSGATEKVEAYEKLEDIPNTGTALKSEDLSDADTTLNAVQKADVNTKTLVGGPLFSNNSDGNATNDITAKNLSIAKDWSTRKVKIETTRIYGEGSSAGDNVLHIKAQIEGKHQFKPNDVMGDGYAVDGDTAYITSNFAEMLINTGGVLANDKRITETALLNAASALDERYVARDGVMGVDLNDEAANMMMYQKSYAAACRLMTTLDEALDKLINGTGVVGR